MYAQVESYVVREKQKKREDLGEHQGQSATRTGEKEAINQLKYQPD